MKLTLLFLISLSLSTLFAQNDSYTSIRKDFEFGRISYEKYMLERFYFIFDREKLDQKYQEAEPSFIKCGTELVQEYYQNKERLASTVREQIESYLNRPFDGDNPKAIYFSPSGKFQINYEITGSHAVPSADLNTNGIPDYVEWIGTYMDYSWYFEVDTLGHLPPPIGTGTYQVSFESMQNYGYTQPVGGRLTRIVLHNTFLGFPVNTDPEGNQKGAAKVTCSHEFKHAIQIVYNNWNEPGWFIEMDATWMEDIAYDYVNDYYNYLSSSQLISPGRSFSMGDGYEDCIWMHYLTEKYDNLLNRKIWERRNTTPGEVIYDNFNAILSEYSSSLSSGVKEYYRWNFATGQRTTPLIPSYQEANKYPTSTLCRNVSLPDSGGGCSLAELSGNLFYYKGSTSNKFFRLYYKGNTAEPQSVQVIVVYKNNTSELFDFNANSEGVISKIIYKKLSDISYIGVIPVMTSTASNFYTYTIKASPFLPAEFTFNPLNDIEVPTQREVKVKVITEENIALKDSLKLYYKGTAGSFIPVRMLATSVPNEFSALIPTFPAGTTVNYYFTIFDTTGRINYYPETAPTGAFSYYIGVDNKPPVINHTLYNSRSKYDFPFDIFTYAVDNIGLDSLYLEYSINDNPLVKQNLIYSLDSLYYTRIAGDSVTFSNVSSFKYRLTAVDSSSQKNRSYFPASGFQNITISPAFIFQTYKDKVITDNVLAGVKDTIEITEDINIEDLNLIFKAEHDRFSDLILRITPPSGTALQLFKRPGFGTTFEIVRNPDIRLDQEAYQKMNPFVPVGSIDLSGEFVPDTLNLSYFNGRNAKGKWILTTIDNRAGVFGKLKKWGLIIKSQNASVVNDSGILPEQFVLYQNYPNPFNPVTKIKYSVPSASLISIRIYNILGEEVSLLVNEVKQQGIYEVSFNASASGLSSGVYLYKLSAGEFTAVRKLVLLK